MIKVRLRYPLALIAILSGLYLFNSASLVPIHPSIMQSIPDLDAGYYLALNTRTKLPDNFPTHYSKNITYIGPLSTISECHYNRIKLRPLHPGISLQLIKVNETS